MGPKAVLDKVANTKSMFRGAIETEFDHHPGRSPGPVVSKPLWFMCSSYNNRTVAHMHVYTWACT